MSSIKKKTVSKKAVTPSKPDEITFNVNDFIGGLGAALEAVLIASPEGVSAQKLALALQSEDKLITKELNRLALEYLDQHRGFELREFDGLWRFYSASAFGDIVSRFLIDGGTARLSVPAMETLAIIAYRQPVTRSDIASIRGVNVDGVIRTLLMHGLIEVSSKSDENGAQLYITTSLFLEKLGVTSLKDLEPLAPFLPDATSDIAEFDDIRKTSRSVAQDDDNFYEDVQADISTPVKKAKKKQ